MLLRTTKKVFRELPAQRVALLAPVASGRTQPALGWAAMQVRPAAGDSPERPATSARELKKPIEATSPEKSGRRSKITELANLDLMKAFLII